MIWKSSGPIFFREMGQMWILSSLCFFFFLPSWKSTKGILRQIHDSHYGNMSRLLRFTDICICKRAHSERCKPFNLLWREMRLKDVTLWCSEMCFPCNQRQRSVPVGLFSLSHTLSHSHSAGMEMCYCKNFSGGFLTSAQEDFSVCFENDRRTGRGERDIRSPL